MGRLYQAQEFAEVTRKVFEKNPHVFIGVDVIVGFPGEGEPEFLETERFLEASHWTKLHVFPFSARRNTKAETLSDPVPSLIKQKRSQLLRDMSQRRLEAFFETQKSKPHAFIAEKEIAPNVWQGHTENYLPIHLEGNLTRKVTYSVEVEALPSRFESLDHPNFLSARLVSTQTH